MYATKISFKMAKCMTQWTNIYGQLAVTQHDKSLFLEFNTQAKMKCEYQGNNSGTVGNNTELHASKFSCISVCHNQEGNFKEMTL